MGLRYHQVKHVFFGGGVGTKKFTKEYSKIWVEHVGSDMFVEDGEHHVERQVNMVKEHGELTETQHGLVRTYTLMPSSTWKLPDVYCMLIQPMFSKQQV